MDLVLQELNLLERDLGRNRTYLNGIEKTEQNIDGQQVASDCFGPQTRQSQDSARNNGPSRDADGASIIFCFACRYEREDTEQLRLESA